MRQRERELSQLVDMVPSHLWRLTPEGEPTFFNRRMVDFLGMDVADTVRPGMTQLAVMVEAAVHPDDAAAFGETLRSCLATGEPFALRYRLRRADGVYHWMSSRAEPLRDPDDGIVQWYGLCHDIDDQMKAEEALRDREYELSQIVDVTPSHVWRLTPQGEPSFVNKRLGDFLGLDVTDYDKADRSRLSGAILTSAHPDDAPAIAQAIGHSLATGEPFAMRWRVRRADGVYRWVDSRAEPLRDAAGVITHWYGVNVDIDDQIHAEEALQRSERQLQQIVDAVPVHIWSWTPSGKLAYVSKRYLEHLGLADGNLEDFTRVTQELVHPEDAPGVRRIAASCLATGDPFVMRYRRLSKDGTYRWMEGRCEPLRDEDGTIVHWYGVSIDIHDGVRAQEELRAAHENLARQSQAASLAELSASIAHEVNQPLAAVVANSDAAQRWLAADPPNIERAQRAVERIIRDANAAADVVSRVRALFRQSAETRDATRLADVIAEAADLLAEEASRRGIHVDVDVEGDLPLVLLDGVQIQQVLVNLMRNGMEAMQAANGDRVLQINARKTDGMVQTEISDCGPGIVSLEKIFEPFFTTKADGMGMGLAICRSIVESHGGRLWAEKNQPRGARFFFTLPVEAKAVQ